MSSETLGRGTFAPGRGSPGTRGTLKGHQSAKTKKSSKDSNIPCILSDVWMCESFPWNLVRHDGLFHSPPRTYTLSTSALTAKKPRFHASLRKPAMTVALVVGCTSEVTVIGVSQEPSAGGSTDKGTSRGGRSRSARVSYGSNSGRMETVLRLRETLPKLRTPCLPMLFQMPSMKPSFEEGLIPSASPTSTPSIPRTSTQIPPSWVIFRILTLSGPFRVRWLLMMSCGVSPDALVAYDQAKRAMVASTRMVIDSDIKKTLVNLAHSRRLEDCWFASSLSLTTCQGICDVPASCPSKGVRSVGSSWTTARRFPLGSGAERVSLRSSSSMGWKERGW